MTTVLAQTSLGSVLDDRLATSTGLLGALGCGLLAALLAYASPHASDDEYLDELPFVPGMVLAMGSPDSDAMAEATTPSPAATPTTDTSAPEPTETSTPEPPPEDAVTDQVTPPSPPRPPRPPTPSPPSSRTDLLPRPPSSSGGPSGGSSGGSPGGPPPKGDPFGDPNGFDDLASDGDAWARGVIAALDGMDVGTVYARPIEGTVRFEMTICKDGTISRVAAKGGTASADERGLVLLEVGRLKIPRPPADIAARMKAPCTKLRHTFSWSTKGTR